MKKYRNAKKNPKKYIFNAIWPIFDHFIVFDHFGIIFMLTNFSKINERKKLIRRKSVRFLLVSII